ncbi:chitooligosaccharidolytic beta-N-acetylglucosaminidase [Culex pipiens pallens]|uniref:chitooligosaccharidolytic beta-N-acetylglucosaminidase n=1 Tax=Culex pipiens pallens TaxID=42434 RepID=UPI0019538E89|nr:chitooligosaccharidolytic beta-N-acetylglucosaminidase [Culex pipiens pallens]
MRTVAISRCGGFLALLVLVFVLINCTLCQNSSPYRCVDGKCLRQYEDDVLGGNDQGFGSLNECRLVCGRYSSLWPIPTGTIQLGQGTREFIPANVEFSFSESSEDEEIKIFFNETQRIFVKNLYKECSRHCNHSTSTSLFVSIKVLTAETKLKWSTNESYELHIATHEDTVHAKIIAGTVFGARHGLETLSQLTTERSYQDGSCLVILSEAQITDSPIYPHRGFLLDTARNFISLRGIKRQLDGMASVKLNVFHWHITDSQSFPLELVSFPQVTRLGAYSAKQIYSQAEVRETFEYARFRGIRVILEFDAPAHAGNGWQWGPSEGYGNLAVCINQQPWRKLCIEPPCGQLNPANPKLYQVLQEVYADFAGLIPSGEILHMGGDEVFFGCWNATQEIVIYINERNFDFLDLWGEFQSKVLALWDQARNEEAPVPTVLWSSHLTDPEVIEKYLPKDRYIIQTWVEGNKDLPKQLLKKGYRLIISTKNAWYFDHGFWGVTSYYQWKKVYNNKILKNPLVLGGEACIWTEFIDEHSLDSRTWPRLAAVGERLWADPKLDASKVEGRFYRQRDRLIARGLNPEAVTPHWCEQNEDRCQ